MYNVAKSIFDDVLNLQVQLDYSSEGDPRKIRPPAWASTSFLLVLLRNIGTNCSSPLQYGDGTSFFGGLINRSQMYRSAP